MTTTDEKFIGELRKLLRATKAKRITWSDTADETTFRWTFKNGMIHIGVAQAPNSSATELKAVLFNQNNSEIAMVAVFADDTSERGTLLRDLYSQARESALSPDDVLASLEAELDQRMKGVPAR